VDSNRTDDTLLFPNTLSLQKTPDAALFSAMPCYSEQTRRGTLKGIQPLANSVFDSRFLYVYPAMEPPLTLLTVNGFDVKGVIHDLPPACLRPKLCGEYAWHLARSQ